MNLNEIAWAKVAFVFIGIVLLIVTIFLAFAHKDDIKRIVPERKQSFNETCNNKFGTGSWKVVQSANPDESGNFYDICIQRNITGHERG